MDDDRRLSRPLAVAYVVMVALLWVSHLVGLVMVLTTGQSSTLGRPWTGGLVLGLIAACYLVLGQVSRQLEPGTNLLMHPFRMVTLFYGAELRVAWRSLRV